MRLRAATGRSELRGAAIRGLLRCFAALALAACDGGGPPARDAGPFVRRDAGPAPRSDRLDLLLVVDSSEGMAEEQALLRERIGALVEALSTGDADGDGDGIEDLEPGDPDFRGYRSVHAGVVTADMGAGRDEPPSCPPGGDDGVLRREGPTSLEGCSAYPSFLRYRVDDDGAREALARELACVASVGAGGCPVAQPLEAALKALSPAGRTPEVAPTYVPLTFFGVGSPPSTEGHGDGANDGFLRADSTLAVVVFTDDDDCSARELSLFEPDPIYVGPLEERCLEYADRALHTFDRYSLGLLQLRRDPRRLVYAVVAGVPPDLLPVPGAPVEWEPLASSEPARRDPRMVLARDPASPTGFAASCEGPVTGPASPPVRLLRVGRALEAGGAHVAVASICEPGLGGFVEAVARAAGEAREL